MATEQFANLGVATITGAMSAIQTTLVISSNSSFPAVTTASTNFFYILIDSELCKVTDNSTTTWVISRANQSTTAATHASGATVYAVLTKKTMDDIVAAATAPGGASTSFGTYAALPAAGNSGNLYLCSDGPYMLRDNGVTWDAFVQGRAVTIPPLVGALTWVNQGGASANNTGGVLALSSPQSVGDNVRALLKAYTAPKTLEIGFWTDIGGVNYQQSGLFVKAAAGALMASYELDSSGPGSAFTMNKFSTATAYSGTDGTFTIRPALPVYIKFVDDGTTNKTGSISFDYGLNYQQLFSVARTSYFTPDMFGIGSNINSNIRTCQMTVFHWKES